MRGGTRRTNTTISNRQTNEKYKHYNN